MRQLRARSRASAAVTGTVLLIGAVLLVSKWHSDRTSPTRTPTGVPNTLTRPLGPSEGRTLYVSRAGSDSNPGTLERPWRTIQKAVTRLKPGQTALVRAGT